MYGSVFAIEDFAASVGFAFGTFFLCLCISRNILPPIRNCFEFNWTTIGDVLVKSDKTCATSVKRERKLSFILCYLANEIVLLRFNFVCRYRAADWRSNSG